MLLYLASKHAIALLEADGRGLHDKRFGNLSCCVVRDLDDRTVVDGRVSKKVCFEFGRSNLMPLQQSQLGVSTRSFISVQCLP
jgi:hypothetical protein